MSEPTEEDLKAARELVERRGIVGDPEWLIPILARFRAQAREAALAAHHALGAWPDCPYCTKLMADDQAGAARAAELEAALAKRWESAEERMFGLEADLARVTRERDEAYGTCERCLGPKDAVDLRKRAEAAEARLREVEQERDRLREFEEYVVCHHCQARWPREEIPEDHECPENPRVAEVRELREKNALLARQLTAATERAAEVRLREVEEAGRAYVATTDPLVACGPVDDPAGDKCGDCRACALARAEALGAQVREASETLVGYGWPADLITGISAVDFSYGAEKHLREKLEAQVRELQTQVEGLEVSRDHYRVSFTKVIEQVRELRAALEEYRLRCSGWTIYTAPSAGHPGVSRAPDDSWEIMNRRVDALLARTEPPKGQKTIDAGHGTSA